MESFFGKNTAGHIAASYKSHLQLTTWFFARLNALLKTSAIPLEQGKALISYSPAHV